jgi:hypothetical protein
MIGWNILKIFIVTIWLFNLLIYNFLRAFIILQLFWNSLKGIQHKLRHCIILKCVKRGTSYLNRILTFRAYWLLINNSFVSLFVYSIKTSCKTKVTNLNRTVIINKNVSGFQITVDYFAWVEIFKPAEYIIHNWFHLSLL